MNGYPSFYPRIALVAPSPDWSHQKSTRIVHLTLANSSHLMALQSSVFRTSRLGPGTRFCGCGFGTAWCFDKYVHYCHTVYSSIYLCLSVRFELSLGICTVPVSPTDYSLSDKTSYRQISWSLEAARLDVIMIISLWNLAGISAAAKRSETFKHESCGFQACGKTPDLAVRRLIT